MKESNLQKQIIDYLRVKQCLVVKFPSVGIYDKRRDTYIRPGRKGVSDLIGCTPHGEFLAIEVKIKPNKPSKEQIEFLAEVQEKGGIGILAYSLEDVIKVL